MHLNLPEKRYYGIGEVAEAFKVNTSLIRFWEKEFDVIKPKKMPRETVNSLQRILKISSLFITW